METPKIWNEELMMHNELILSIFWILIYTVLTYVEQAKIKKSVLFILVARNGYFIVSNIDSHDTTEIMIVESVV